MELKHKTDEQINPVNGVEPWDQFDGPTDKQTKTKYWFSEKVSFELRVKQWKSDGRW